MATTKVLRTVSMRCLDANANGVKIRTTNPTKRRLLLVSQYDLYPQTVGGLPIRCREFCDFLSRMFDVYVLTLNGVRNVTGELSRDVLRAAYLERFEKKVSWKLGRFASALWDATIPGRRVKNIIRKLRPDAVFFGHFESLPKAVFRELLQIPGPVVAYFGNSLGGGLLDALEEVGPNVGATSKHKTLQSASESRQVSFVFNCEYLRCYYQGVISDHFARRRTHRYSEGVRDYVLYDGAETDRFYPADNLPYPAVFAFLGRPVHPGKGYLDFCKAMTLLPENCVGGIQIIGNGNQLAEGLAILEDGGRSHLLRHVGSASQDDASKLLREASVMVLPTRDDSIPIAVTEAMATGLAVVTSRLAGIPELIQDGKSGLLVDPAHLGQLVHACRRLAEDKVLTARLGAAARALIVKKYCRRHSLERMAMICTEAFSTQSRLHS